tara:strand:- start:3529 stop:4209 length:681 start_codon:yes stop_codon:yes gene_type:complete
MKVKENHKEYLDHLIRLKKDFKIRESVNYAEIVRSDGEKIVSTKNNQFVKGLYLFAMVKRDIERYIAENGYITPSDELPVNYTSDIFDENNKVVGMDMDNAYWTIAYLKGYISENTYNKGLEKKEFKPIRLSALSTLGKGKTYKVFKDGKYEFDEIAKANKELENFYLDIRYSTYGVLLEIANELGDDFHSWKTDCIFFKDTKNNIDLVRKRFDEFGIQSKVELLG